MLIPALKGAGDVRFPVAMGMLSMWGIGVAGAWLLGIRLHWGLAGIWIAMAIDEWVRGLVMLRRGRSGAWQAAGRLEAACADAAEVAAVEIGEDI